MTSSASCSALPFFPIAERNETVPSVASRYLARIGRYSKQQVYRIGLSISTVTDIPTDISALQKRLPSGHPWLIDKRAVFNHTGIRYRTFFLSSTSRAHVFKELSNGLMRQPYLQLGSAVHARGFVGGGQRECAACVERDLRKLGFSCFYRQHQLPGVAFCAEHGLPLQISCATCFGHARGAKWHMAGQCFCSRPSPYFVTPGEITRTQKEVLCRLASQSQMTLECVHPEHEQAPQQILREKLIARFGKCRSGLPLDKIADTIELHYGLDLLSWLGVSTRQPNGDPSTWVSLRTSDPLILHLIAAMCEDNLVAAVSPSELISPVPIRVPGQAGYNTQRVGNPILDQDATTLLKLLQENNGHVTVMAKLLGVGPDFMIREYIRRGIRIPLKDCLRKRIGSARLEAATAQLKSGVAKTDICWSLDLGHWLLTRIEADNPTLAADHQAALTLKLREVNRGQLLRHLNAHPEDCRADVTQACGGPVSWLRMHDREWVERNLPTKLKKTGGPKQRARRIAPGKDAEWSQQVRRVYETELAGAFRPERLGITRLLRAVTGRRTIQHLKDRYPLLAKALDDCIESRDAYIKRQIAWAIGSCRTKGIELTIDAIRIEAHVPRSAVATRLYLLPASIVSPC